MKCLGLSVDLIILLTPRYTAASRVEKLQDFFRHPHLSVGLRHLNGKSRRSLLPARLKRSYSDKSFSVDWVVNRHRRWSGQHPTAPNTSESGLHTQQSVMSLFS